MRRGAVCFNGQLALPGVGKLPAKLARSRPKRGGNAETALQCAVLDWAHLRRSSLWLVRVQSGEVHGFKYGPKRHGHDGIRRATPIPMHLKLAPEGTPDLLGMALPSGKLVAVEVKLPGEHPTPAQLDTMRHLVRGGAWVFVARDVEAFARDFEAALGGRYVAPAELTA